MWKMIEIPQKKGPQSIAELLWNSNNYGLWSLDILSLSGLKKKKKLLTGAQF